MITWVMGATLKQKRPPPFMTDAERRKYKRDWMRQARQTDTYKEKSEADKPRKREYDGVHYRKNRTCRKAHSRAYHRSHREQLVPKMRERGRQRRIQLRAEIIEAYGSRCTCCGVIEKEFLSIDHINGGGTAHRKSIGKSGDAFYRWLKEKGFPKDDFQLLCHNCNFAKGIYGVCPHKEMK